MCALKQPIFFAGMLVVLAVLARIGLADRDAVTVLLLVLPILAVVSIFRGRGARCA